MIILFAGKAMFKIKMKFNPCGEAANTLSDLSLRLLLFKARVLFNTLQFRLLKRLRSHPDALLREHELSPNSRGCEVKFLNAGHGTLRLGFFIYHPDYLSNQALISE
jgi:hypothetical protein